MDVMDSILSLISCLRKTGGIGEGNLVNGFLSIDALH